MTLEPTRRALLSGAGALAVSGCARRERPRDRLRVACAPLTLIDMYRAVAAAFEAENPSVTVELLPSAGYDEIMQRDFRLALVGDQCDVSHVALNYLRFYVERDLAAPLDRFIADEPEGLLTAHASVGRTAGVTHALPFAVSAPVSYLNADLLRRAGRDADAVLAGGWPAILDAAAAVSRMGGRTSGIFFDYTAGSSLAWQMLVFGRGGRMMTPDERQVAFDDAAGLWSARHLAALRKAGQRNISRENARMGFSAGQLGIYQNTSANIARFTDAASSYRLAYGPLPILEPAGRLPAAGNALVIPTPDPARQDLAWKYVRFAAGPRGQTLMAKSTGYLSLNRAALEDRSLLKPLLSRDPQYAGLYRLIDRLDAWYAFPGPRSDQVSQLITNAMREVLIGRSQPEAALAHMKADVEKVLRL